MARCERRGEKVVLFCSSPVHFLIVQVADDERQVLAFCILMSVYYNVILSTIVWQLHV